MKQTTITAIQAAQEKGLIVPFTSDVKNAKGTVPKGQIIGIWASRYDTSLIDALVDLYQPLKTLFKQIDGKCEGCFLLVNTATESILCLYLGLHNKINMFVVDTMIRPLEKGSIDWVTFTEIDKYKVLDPFVEGLREFGSYARAYNESNVDSETETLDSLGNKALLKVKRYFPAVSWGDLNNQDAW